MLKTGMIIAERYEIAGQIGSGGMANVYKAKDHKLNRYVAVKVLKEEFRKIYRSRKRAGDKNLYFFDGTNFWAPDDYSENTIDSAHPTDLGFFRMAEKLRPVLLKLLKKYELIDK